MECRRGVVDTMTGSYRFATLAMTRVDLGAGEVVV